MKGPEELLFSQTSDSLTPLTNICVDHINQSNSYTTNNYYNGVSHHIVCDSNIDQLIWDRSSFMYKQYLLIRNFLLEMRNPTYWWINFLAYSSAASLTRDASKKASTTKKFLWNTNTKIQTMTNNHFSVIQDAIEVIKIMLQLSL